MNIEYFKEYRHFKNLGIKAKTKEYMDKFIRSFENYAEKELWTIAYLPKIEMDSNGRIRNELFEEIIFPVLWNGYHNKNVSLMVWLARLDQNYYQNNRIWEKMEYKTFMDILRECYELEPDNNEVIALYLEGFIGRIDYSIHEWPCGILFGHNFATIDECKIILEENKLIRKLDRNKKYETYIDEYESKTKEYMDKIKTYNRRRL